MSFKEICQAGLKILAGIAAGVAVFIGISKIMKKTGNEENVNQETEEKIDEGTGEIHGELRRTPGKGEQFANGVRKVQDVCGKVFTIVQTLSLVADSISRVFGSSGVTQSYGSDPHLYGNYYGQPIDMGNGRIWNRVSPCIVEAGPSYGYYGGNNGYPI